MDTQGISEDDIFRRLGLARDRDFQFSGGRVLGSMCTEPHHIAKKAYNMFWEANLGNPGLCPGTEGLHDELISMLGDLLGDPAAAGFLVGGGTESNITSLWVAKKFSGGSEVVIPQSAHFSFMKAVDLLGMTAVVLDLDEEYRMDLGQLEAALSPRTAAVVGVAGTTELGVVDPLPEISDICGGDVPLHVDAAFGGFVIPFLKELGCDLPDFDFCLPNVFSISVDPHKMGMSTIPSGAMMYRDSGPLEKIAVDSPYLTTLRHTALSGTRASASVAATWAVMKYLGRDGYREMVRGCWENTQYLKKRVEEAGLTLVCEPVMNIMGVALKDPAGVEDALMEEGWRVSQARYPPCLRLIIMPHVTRGVIDEFVPVLEKVCKETKEL